MKKLQLITILLLALSFNANAQLFRLGIKGGINYANQSGGNITINSNNYNDPSAITNFHFGLLAEVKLSESFSIQPELLYTTQGADYKNSASTIVLDAYKDYSNKVGYLSVPVMVKIYLGKTLSLELGPQASLLVSEKNSFDVKNANTFDFGLAGGIGINLTKSIFLQARYVAGLTEASKDATVKNSVVQISAGLMF